MQGASVRSNDVTLLCDIEFVSSSLAVEQQSVCNMISSLSLSKALRYAAPLLKFVRFGGRVCQGELATALNKRGERQPLRRRLARSSKPSSPTPRQKYLSKPCPRELFQTSPGQFAPALTRHAEVPKRPEANPHDDPKPQRPSKPRPTIRCRSGMIILGGKGGHSATA